MIRSIRLKLVLSYLAIALMTALLVYLLIRFTSDQRLKRLILEQQTVQLAEETAYWYRTEGSWEGFPDYFQTLHPLPPHGNNRPPPEGDRPPPSRITRHGIVSADLQTLVPFLTFVVSDRIPEIYLNDAKPVIVAGETVAWIIPSEEGGISLQAEEQIYLERTNQVVLIALAAGTGLSLVLGLGFSQVLLRPIFALTQASQRIADGDLSQEVTTTAKDELGLLADSFNSMSLELARAEQRRRRLTADIAHDLSTPLQVISGYIETAQDGSLTLTPERIDIVASEVNHLSMLISDLDTLAQTDSNSLSLHIEALDLNDYLPQIANKFTQLATSHEIEVAVDLPEQAKLPAIQADRERLAQVLGNIFNNALRYTPAAGTIQVSAEQRDNRIRLSVQDSGSGIAPDELPFVFDRFYQTDQSRSTKGKMGLGLAISKGLVEAMGGEISAESGGLGQGTTFAIQLPIWSGI